MPRGVSFAQLNDAMLKIDARSLISGLSFLFIVISAQAQTASVKGVVTDEVTGEMLPFVSVAVQGATTGTSTDFDGAFELSGLQPGLVNLSFSSVGYKTATRLEVELTPARPAFLTVVLEPLTVAVEAAEVVALPLVAAPCAGEA